MPGPREFSRARVAIIGDLMLDIYIQGGVERLSPEAPVPVVHQIQSGSSRAARRTLPQTSRRWAVRSSWWGWPARTPISTDCGRTRSSQPHRCCRRLRHSAANHDHQDAYPRPSATDCPPGPGRPRCGSGRRRERADCARYRRDHGHRRRDLFRLRQGRALRRVASSLSRACQAAAKAGHCRSQEAGFIALSWCVPDHA